MIDGTSSAEHSLPDQKTELVKAEPDKPMFTDSVTNTIKDQLAGNLHTVRIVAAHGQNYGRTEHEIDTDTFRIDLVDRDSFNRGEHDGATELRFHQKDSQTKEMPLLLDPGPTTYFSLQDITKIEVDKSPAGTPQVIFTQEGPTHSVSASISRDGNLQIFVFPNPQK
jgi:hypothetical protein